MSWRKMKSATDRELQCCFGFRANQNVNEMYIFVIILKLKARTEQ